MILPEPVQLTKRLINFNTCNPGGSETECINFLCEILQDAGFTTNIYEFAEGRPSLVARLGKGRRPALCFAGHIDTVPLTGTKWQFDPFGGEIHQGRVYGRGAADMKSGVAAFVTAACRLSRRLATKNEDFIIIIVAGEETGCQGSRYLAERSALLGDAGALIVAEPSSNYPLIGHKGALWLSARFSGRAAHGSMPQLGDNAIYKAANAVKQLQNFRFGVSPHPLLGVPTLNIGFLHGGSNINSVPDTAEMGIDIRTIPGIEHNELVVKITNCVGESAELSELVSVNALWTDPNNAWVQDVFGIVTNVTGVSHEPRTVAYFTDGSPLQAAYGGIPTLILGPGASGMAHCTDEYCLTADIVAASDIYEHVARKWYDLDRA